MSKYVATACLLFCTVLSGGVFAQDMSLSNTLALAEGIDRHNSRAVRAIQTNLAYYSFYAGPVDGLWGPQTELAIDLAFRAEQPHLYQIVEHTSDNGVASLVPISVAVSVVPSDSFVTLPHINRTVPEYYHIEGRGTVWLDIRYQSRETAQRYQTLSVDRVDGYRVIAPTIRVPVVRH